MSAMQEGAHEKPLHLRAREERKRQKLNQREVATKAGMGLRAYQMFEAGQSTPQPGNLEGILWALGIDKDGDRPQLRAVPGAADGGEASAPWPPGVQVFLDMAGAYLMAIDDEQERLELIHETTRWWINRRRG